MAQCNVVVSYLFGLETGVSYIDTAQNMNCVKICFVQSQLWNPSTLLYHTSSSIVGKICWRDRDPGNFNSVLSSGDSLQCDI